MLVNNSFTVFGHDIPRHLILQKNILTGKILLGGSFFYSRKVTHASQFCIAKQPRGQIFQVRIL